MEPYEGPEPYIFISYARKDKERVRPYLDALSSAGYRVWYDAGIHPGERWTEKLVEKVEACAAFCPLFSEAFNASRFCFEETEYAYRKDKPIVPAYLEEMKPDDLRPLYRLLGSRQDLRLYQFDSPAQFAERLDGQQAFAPCKVPEWHKIGQIQWRLSADGVLSIAKNEDVPGWFRSPGSIPSYQYDPIHGGSTAPWMEHRKKILSVEIADDIDAIGDHAFRDCKSLTKAHIGDSVTKIGGSVFQGCESLTEVRIPDSVTKIGDSAFFACESLTEVCIPDSVTKIGIATFACCVSLTEMRIPDSVTEIGDFAFMHCESLTEVRIPDSVTEIGKGAFWCCKSLTEVRIPDSVTKIGDYAFLHCDNLKSVEIPAVAEIVEGLFPTFPEHTLVKRREAPPSVTA